MKFSHGALGKCTSTAKASALGAALILSVVAPTYAQTWTACPSNTINGGPAFGIWPMTDGSVISHGNGLNVWVKLTPSAISGYAGGTWTTLANSPFAMGGAEEHVLNNGDLMETGCEYLYVYPSGWSPTDFNCVQIYNPATNVWTQGPSGLYTDIGDSASEILANGNWFGSSRTTMATELYNPTSNSWSAAAAKTDNTGDEEAWADLTNGKVFALSNTSHDLYTPSSNTWAQTAAPPTAFYPGDVGPVIPLYDGRILCLGYKSAVYTPSSNTWLTLPAYPALASDEDAEDSYGTIMPNGHVMFELYSVANGPNGIGDFNPSTDTYSTIAFPSGASGGPFSMAPLPNGQIMVTFGNLNYLYTPAGSPTASWRPAVTSVALQSGTTYTLTGTQLSGLVLGGTEGDDMECKANFPIVYLTSGSSTYYCKTTNPSTRFPQSAGTQTVTFTLPSGLANGAYSLYVATCGVSSASAYSFTVGGSSGFGATNRILCQENGLSLDNYNVTTSGSDIYQQPYSSGNLPEQTWTLTASGSYYIIKCQQSGLALTPASTSAGALITQATATGATNQNWAVISLGSGLYEINNEASGLVMDNHSLTAGGQVYQQAYTSGATNQEWTIATN